MKVDSSGLGWVIFSPRPSVWGLGLQGIRFHDGSIKIRVLGFGFRFYQDDQASWDPQAQNAP